MNNPLLNPAPSQDSRQGKASLKARILLTVLWLLGLIIGGWTLAHLPLNGIAQKLAVVSVGELAFWICVNVTIILLFNYRWWLLGNALQIRIGFLHLLVIRQAGQSISFITPGPQFGGEPLQVFWLWRAARTAVHKALLALGLDRFFELWVNFSILIAGVLLLIASPVNNSADWGAILLILLGLGAGLSLIGILLVKQPRWLNERLNKVTHGWQSHSRLHHIKTQWDLLREELATCLGQQKQTLGVALLLSLLGWVGLFGELYLTLWMAGVTLNLYGFLLLFVAFRLALLLPVPGGIGTMEAAIFWTFTYLQLPMESAATLIGLMRLRDALVLGSGLACLAWVGASKRAEAN